MDIQNNSIVTDADTDVLDSQITQISNDLGISLDTKTKPSGTVCALAACHTCHATCISHAI